MALGIGELDGDEMLEHGCHYRFLNTNYADNTNIFILHTELLERGRTRISRISRIFVRGDALTWGTRYV